MSFRLSWYLECFLSCIRSFAGWGLDRTPSTFGSVLRAHDVTSLLLARDHLFRPTFDVHAKKTFPISVGSKSLFTLQLWVVTSAKFHFSCQSDGLCLNQHQPNTYNLHGLHQLDPRRGAGGSCPPINRRAT